MDLRNFKNKNFIKFSERNKVLCFVFGGNEIILGRIFTKKSPSHPPIAVHSQLQVLYQKHSRRQISYMKYLFPENSYQKVDKSKEIGCDSNRCFIHILYQPDRLCIY